jgi:ArsR family transcriptional regulator
MNICSYEVTVMKIMRHSLKIFKALSDPTRLRILLLLLKKDLCVCELTYILGMEQSRVSHQLRVLRHAGLVEDTRDGKWIIYRVPEDKKKDLKLILERFTGDSLKDSEKMTRDHERLKAYQKISARNCPASIEGERPE